MSHQSLSASHQVSISHDPLEEQTSAGLDQLSGGRRAGPTGPHAGVRPRQGSLRLPAISPPDFRQALLAGALGLFAAWLVSGRRSEPRSQNWRSARGGDGYAADREEPVVPAPQPRLTAGPEGASSRADLELDALNP